MIRQGAKVIGGDAHPWKLVSVPGTQSYQCVSYSNLASSLDVRWSFIKDRDRGWKIRLAPDKW